MTVRLLNTLLEDKGCFTLANYNGPVDVEAYKGDFTFYTFYHDEYYRKTMWQGLAYL